MRENTISFWFCFDIFTYKPLVLFINKLQYLKCMLFKLLDSEWINLVGYLSVF